MGVIMGETPMTTKLDKAIARLAKAHDKAFIAATREAMYIRRDGRPSMRSESRYDAAIKYDAEFRAAIQELRALLSCPA